MGLDCPHFDLASDMLLGKDGIASNSSVAANSFYSLSHCLSLQINGATYYHFLLIRASVDMSDSADANCRFLTGVTNHLIS